LNSSPKTSKVRGFLPASQITPSTIRLELLEARARGSRRGPSLLFIPGAGHAAWAFAEWIEFFAERGFDSYSLSLRGHGASEGGETLRTASFDDYLADVRQAIARIGGPVVLIGHSMGGNLIQKHLESEIAAGAVLLCTSSAEDVWRSAPRTFAAHPWTMLKHAVTGNPDYLFHAREVCRAIFFDGDRSAAAERALDRLGRQSESKRVIQDLMKFKAGDPKGFQPMLIVGGGRDKSIPLASHEARARQYKARVKFYEQAPHEFLLLDGWQACAVDLLNWMEDVFTEAA